MIAQLAQSIMQKFNGSANLKNELVGGLYYQRAPYNITSPYAVFNITGQSRQEFMGSNKDALLETEMQVNIYVKDADGGEKLATLLRLFQDVFNWVTLAISGYSNYKVQPDTIGPVLFIDEIWQGTIFYSIGTQKE